MATPGQTRRPAAQQARWREQHGPQLRSLSDAARRLLRGTPPLAAPMISRAGIRSEAQRARSIMRATIRDQLLTRRG